MDKEHKKENNIWKRRTRRDGNINSCRQDFIHL